MDKGRAIILMRGLLMALEEHDRAPDDQTMAAAISLGLEVKPVRFLTLMRVANQYTRRHNTSVPEYVLFCEAKLGNIVKLFEQ